MKTYEALIVESRGAADWLTLNRPGNLNAFDAQMIDELFGYFEALKDNTSVRVVVMQGAGRAFCAGADMNLFEQNLAQGADPDFTLQRKISNIIQNMRRCPQPIIALIRGAAVGGGFSLALAADIRLAGQSAKMNCAFIKLGLTGADMGTSFHLPRLVGLANAAGLMYTGRYIGAEKAERIGLVNEALPDEELETAAQGYVDEMLATGPLGLRLTKEALNAAVDAPSLTATLAMEDRNQVMTLNSPDLQEGLAAYQERRPTKWAGGE